MTNGKILLLGTNLGNRRQNLQVCRQEVANRIGEIKTESNIYETAAWGKTDQPAFLNQVIIIDTVLTPKELLRMINAIEKDMGRVRMEKWGERMIDIDILYFDDLVFSDSNLTIPHPEIPNRRFTLVPLAEVLGDFCDPVTGKSIRTLLEECSDTSEVHQI